MTSPSARRTRLALTALSTGLVLATGYAAPAAAAVPAAAESIAPAQHQPKGRHVALTVTADGLVQAPASLRAGRYTFDVHGAGWVQLARPVKGYTRAEFLRDVHRRADSAAAFTRHTRLARFAGGSGSLPEGVLGPDHPKSSDATSSSFTTTLHPGTYWLFDLYRLDDRPYRISVLKVTGTATRSVFPRVAGIVRSSEGRLTAPRTLPASGEVLIRNAGRTVTAVVLLPAGEGMGVRAPRAVAAASRRLGLAEGAPQATGSGDSPDVAMSAFVAPGTSFLLRYDLPPGRYVLVSLGSDDVRELTLR